MRRALALLCLPALASCAQQGGEAPRTRSVTLPGHIAEVAGQPIGPIEVAEVARAQRVTPARALELVTSEIRIAKAAEEIGFADRPETRVERRAALAAALLQSAKREAESTPPTAEELAQVRKDHWLELDRPEALQVVHVVAQAKPDDAKRGAAKVLGDKLLAALRGATDPDDFKARAQTIDGGGVTITVEAVGPFVRDGRVATEQGGSLDAAFVVGAFALAKPLDISPVVPSSFGFHVIMLLERLPPASLRDEELLPLVSPEVHAQRASRTIAALRKREPIPVEIARNVEDLFQFIGTTPQP